MEKQTNDYVRYGVGLDISKADFHCCVMGIGSDNGVSVLGRKKFDQTQGGYSKLLLWLEKHGLTPTSPLQAVMEATGVYHESLLYWLYETGFSVSLILAKQGKDYARSLNQHSKTDRLDSMGLAHLAAHRKLAVWQPFSEHIYQIRSLMRHRRALIEEKTTFKNRLHAHQHAHLPAEFPMASLRAIIEQLESHIAAAEAQAIELAKADEDLWRKLSKIEDSFFGVGIITLLEVVAETNGFQAFKSVSQLVSYAGYDIIENQSGKHTGKTRISKRGNARLRAAMYFPVLCLIRGKIGPFYSMYTRLLERNGYIKKKAQVALQRKLLVILYTLWKKDEAFDEQKHEQLSQKSQSKPQKVAGRNPEATQHNEQQNPQLMEQIPTDAKLDPLQAENETMTQPERPIAEPNDRFNTESEADKQQLTFPDKPMLNTNTKPDGRGELQQIQPTITRSQKRRRQTHHDKNINTINRNNRTAENPSRLHNSKAKKEVAPTSCRSYAG